MLSFSAVDPAPVKVPPPRLNGGLYTGTPFRLGAQWADVPVVPDSLAMFANLRSANPPPNIIDRQYPMGQRVGNNSSDNTAYEALGFAPYQPGSALFCKR